MKKRHPYSLPSIDYPQKSFLRKQLFYDDAKTGVGKCYFCKKEIPKGTPVFWFWAKFQKRKTIFPPKGAQTLTLPMTSSTELNIKRKICFRCIEPDLLKSILDNYREEIKKIKKIRKQFRRTLKGKRCKRAIENCVVLEELQKEEWQKN
jgi:hypothetical protein